MSLNSQIQQMEKIAVRTGRELFSSVSHGVGGLLSIGALVVMIVWAAFSGRAGLIVGASIFGSALILLYFTSALYHFFSGRAKDVFRRIDHAMIYVLIAGTYTPICLALPSRGWGWSIFGVVWGLALIGIVLKSSLRDIQHWIFPMLYILLGWLIIIAAYPMINWLSWTALFWLALGGVIYTSGVIFFLIDHYKPHISFMRLNMHDVFHLFVLAGSLSHFWFVFKYVL